VIYVLNPFGWSSEFYGYHTDMIFGALVIGMWFASNSLKRSVVFRRPTTDAERSFLKAAYLCAALAAVFIIAGAIAIFFGDRRIMRLIGVGGIAAGLVIQFVADRLYRPLLTPIDG
jgi:hypothetical protein